VAIPIQLRQAEISQLVALQFASNDSPTVSDRLRDTAIKRIEPSIGLVHAVTTTVLTACGSTNPDCPREKSRGHF
jgi:hypothetical protein